METFGQVVIMGEQLSYCYGLDEKMQTLKRKLENLSSREADVNKELEYAESLSLKKRRQHVENWLTNVERIKRDVQSMEQVLAERRLLGRVQLGKRVEELSGEVTQLVEQGRFPEGLTFEAHETKGDALLTTKLLGHMFQANMEKIWACLMEKEVLIIGVYGMGGVGKTTMVTHIHNKLLEDPNTFDHVFWITVSQDFSIHKLQNDIAKMVNLDLSNVDDEKKRAAKLAQALLRRKQSVLILDDVWNHFLLEKVGIPLRVNGCKLILTTRSLDLCRRMSCQVKIKVEPLSEEEAWNLFLEKLGHEIALTAELKDITRSVAKECAGLPLAIVVMAGSMRGVDDICEWRNALEVLKESKVGQDDMETEVFQVLRFSYWSLNDSKVQQCFLYCSLYPEDYKIKREELIERFIDEGLVDRMKSRQAQIDRGHTILNKLENSCLLEGIIDYFPHEKKFLKMHDLIRDMAVQIVNVSPRFMVEAGIRLKDLPDEENWTEDLEKVSLMHNKISEIPSSASPRCPRLSTLMLQYNGLRKIPDSFFEHMRGLEVLDLSYNAMEHLPNSISNLENLRALLLRECDKLNHVPSLAKLTALRRLDLGHTGITEVPKGMEMLVNLRYLDLSAHNLKMIPVGTLAKLSHLQHLVVYRASATSRVVGEEVASLTKLETFHGQFCEVHNFNAYSKSLQEGPSNYLLQVGSDDPDVTPNESDMFEKRVILKRCNISRGGEESLVLPQDVEYLYMQECNDVRSLCDITSLTNATNLKASMIKKCKGVEQVLSSSSLSSSSILPLQSLESLRLAFLQNLSDIITFDGSKSPPPGTLSCLKEFRIYNCPNIKKLFTMGLLKCLHNLEELHVEDCRHLVEIVAVSSSDEDEVEEYKEEGIGTVIFTLPKLRFLQLWDLPELKSICTSNSVLVCDSLRDIILRYCRKLKRIPLSLPWIDGQPSPPPSLQIIKAFPKEWWESLEWDHPHAKNVLQPFCHFSRYV
ncbi:probable disease resistance protein At4g27220 isoform X2 [Alnus glutinosa]|uniref:probable disease resistance protein At4g27220 isoform X2 n=1 Tax=Alnus glutinosa TaxID=3517 RepID=UPI002D775E56|nr:probable disease resistance protein At4g27220 isoform X2 [Alnus glutinosa]